MWAFPCTNRLLTFEFEIPTMGEEDDHHRSSQARVFNESGIAASIQSGKEVLSGIARMVRRRVTRKGGHEHCATSPSVTRARMSPWHTDRNAVVCHGGFVPCAHRWQVQALS
jgi:hypothetical protein